MAAPRELTFEVVAAAGKKTGETDSTLVEFETQLGERVIKTIEEVRFRPPESIVYRWVEGLLDGVEEEIRFDDSRSGETLMTYSGSLEAGPRLRGWLRTLFVVRPTSTAS